MAMVSLKTQTMFRTAIINCMFVKINCIGCPVRPVVENYATQYDTCNPNALLMLERDICCKVYPSLSIYVVTVDNI